MCCGEAELLYLNNRVLEQLHQSLPGMARMKNIARSMVWWPGIDTDIETKVQSCTQCKQNQKNPAKSPLQPWKWPEEPWSRLHIDHAGPFLGKTFLLYSGRCSLKVARGSHCAIYSISCHHSAATKNICNA